MSTATQAKHTGTYIAAAVLIIIIIAGAGYYYFTQMVAPPSVTTASTISSVTSMSMSTISSPTLKDTLILGTTDSVETTLDPSNAYDYFGWAIIFATGSPLVEIRPGSAAGPSDIVPSLATDWSASADGLTWTFTLRQNVKFGDGSCCFNASTVKYSFDRGINLADPDGPFVGIGVGGVGGFINRTEVISNNQVAFHLNFPFQGFPILIANAAIGYMVNPKWAPMATVNYTEGNARASYPTDFGPYVLSSWTRVGGKESEMRLDANPYYWNATGGLPMTPHLVIKFYSDATALALAIKSGEIDIAYRQLRPTDINSMKTDSSVKVWQGVGAFIQYLVFQEKIKPFDDARVRRAIAAAVDRPTITSTVFLGLAQPLYSMIPNGMFGHQDAFKSYGDANYTYTQQLLAQMGYSATNKLVVDLWYETSGHYQSSPDIATVLKSSIEASGVISVNLHGVDWSTYGANRRAESMPMYIMGWYPDFADPDDYIYPFLDSSGGSWLHDNYANPQTDSLIAQSRAATGSAREALFGQVQGQLVSDVPMVPLFQGGNFAISKPGVGGIVLDISYQFRYQLLYAPA